MIRLISLDFLLLVLIELYKTRPSSSRKETIKVARTYGYQYGRYWSWLSNIRSTRFYEVKFINFPEYCRILILSWFHNYNNFIDNIWCLMVISPLSLCCCNDYYSQKCAWKKWRQKKERKLTMTKLAMYRSSHLEVFCKKGALRYFAKFTRKHLFRSVFFNKVVSLYPAALLKKVLQHRCF